MPLAWALLAAANLAAQDADPSLESLKIDLGDAPRAEKALNAAIEKNPKHWLAYRARAMVRRSRKKYQKAFEDATSALKINPRDAWSHDILALIHIDLGRYLEAVSEANEALALNPKDAQALAARARAWESLQRPSQGLADLRQASAIDPQLGGLYRQALEGQRGEWLSSSILSPVSAMFLAALGVPLILFAFVLYRWADAAEPKPRPAMRRFDRLGFSLETPAKDSARPSGFRLMREIGEGAMGIVYEALDKALQRKVAIKKLREDIAHDPWQKQQFMREARTVAGLKHPNIVEIYTVLEQSEGLFLVFEFVSGQPLNRIINLRLTLNPIEALCLAEQVAEALDYAHEKGVTHQDLKPSNIIVDGAAAKVMDFGIARHEHFPPSSPKPDTPIGTPAYMAPEREQSGRPGMKESDIYSLGVCFYEMVSGKRPFGDGQAYFQKMQRTFRPLSTTLPNLPPELDLVMAKVLHPEPLERHGSAREFIADLKKVLVSNPSSGLL